MSQIFDKAKRMRAHITLHRNALIIPDMDTALNYLKALEEIARAAGEYVTNSTPANAVKLNAALETVDRMRT